MFGYSFKEEFLSEFKASEHYVDPDERRRLLDELQMKGEVRNFQTRFFRKDGTPFWVEFSARMYPEDGYLEGAVIDITERKRAEEALRESETQYRETLDAMGDWILAVDPDLRIVLFNAAFMQINKQLGLTTDVIGRTPMEIFPFLPDTLLDEYRWVFENKRVLITQETTKIGGREFITESRKTPLLKEGRILRVISVIRDITEQKRLEAQLQQAQKMEAIGTLAGGVAHDLNNILAGIVSYPDVLLMQIPEDSHLRGPITTMKESGKKAADIVQDLLTLARRSIPSTEVSNLNDIVSEYLKSPVYQKLKLYHPEVEVETNLETDLLHIIGSHVHLSKAVMNLISNAAEAMPDGGKILISTENRYVDRPVRGYDDVEEGDYVTLTVSDSGVGISSQDLARVFEPFYTKKKMRRSGTGLGMAVVWGTVKDHKGYIDLQSAEGQGTTITLYFPATRQQPIKGQPGLAVEDYMGRGQSILVVDDVKGQREIAFTILSELGYSVTSVSSGEEAVEYMKRNSVDLLLLDMIMDPGIDGLDTYKQILELYPRQKAIIASGFSETDRVKEAQKLGAGQYIKKPYTLEKIGIVVKAELEK
jgi:PAS domain S-box-containing protein